MVGGSRKQIAQCVCRTIQRCSSTHEIAHRGNLESTHNMAGHVIRPARRSRALARHPHHVTHARAREAAPCDVTCGDDKPLTLDGDDRVRTAVAPLGIGNHTHMTHIRPEPRHAQLGVRTARAKERCSRAQQHGERQSHPHCNCYRKRCTQRDEHP